MQSRRGLPVFLLTSLRLTTGQECAAPGTCAPAVPEVQQCASGTCGPVAPEPVCASPTCGPKQVVQTYQPPPTVSYQQQPPQTTMQQQPPQTSYQRTWQYVPGEVVPPPPIDPVQQPPMFNLLRKVSYEPFIKVFEHEIPYIHYETFEKRGDCEVKPLKDLDEDIDNRNHIYVREEHKTKKALRVVQHFPEPVTVDVPMYLGTIDETSQTAHNRVWYDLPVEVVRIPPDMQISLPPQERTPGKYVPVTRKITVQPPPVPVTVQPPPVPVTVQSPPVQMVAQVDEQVTCGSPTGTCGAPAAPTCASGTCGPPAVGTCGA